MYINKFKLTVNNLLLNKNIQVILRIKLLNIRISNEELRMSGFVVRNTIIILNISQANCHV
jgi:hypothetical protein